MKKSLLILSTSSDMSAIRLREEGEQVFSKVAHLDYQDLLQSSLPKPILPFSGEDCILIARQPYAANHIEENYVGLLYEILSSYKFKSVFDDRLYQQNFVLYEDKYFQSLVFDRLGAPYARLFNSERVDPKDYPIIAKKRLSSRANSNFVMSNSEELRRFIYANDACQFIFQKYHKLVADYRLLVLKGAPVGVVERKVKIKDGNRTTVEVVGSGSLPQLIIDQGILIANKIATDLCGLDVGKTEKGDYFFIEYNTSPQFVGFERETGRNIAREILNQLL